MIDTDNIKYKRTLFTFFVLFLGLGFLVSATSLLEGIDRNILEYINKGENEILIGFSKLLDYIGSVFAYILIALIVLGYSIKVKKYSYLKLYSKGAIITGILIQLLKLIYDRQRPLEFFRIEQSGMSFPSGHAMGAASLYLLLAYIVSKENENIEKLCFFVAAIAIIAMGWSRLYLGVHWPSDIVGGYLGGICVFIVMVNIDKGRIVKKS